MEATKTAALAQFRNISEDLNGGTAEDAVG
jgi:hypothetical protein